MHAGGDHRTGRRRARASSCRRAPCTAWRTPARTPMRVVAVFRPAGSPAGRVLPRRNARAYPGRRSWPGRRTHSRGGVTANEGTHQPGRGGADRRSSRPAAEAAGASSSSSRAPRHEFDRGAQAARARRRCTASIAIEGPFTGPVAQVGLEQLHFAQLAVANDNAANRTNVTLAQDDTQLTPSLAVTEDPVDHRHQRGRGDRAGRQPGGRGRRAAVRQGGDGVHLRLGDAAGARQQRQEPDVLPRRPRRRRPGPAGRQLRDQPPAPEGRPDHRRRRGLFAGSGQRDDPDPQEGRDQGQPSDAQRHRHRRDARQRDQVACHLAADRGRDGDVPAVADGRPTPRCSARTPSKRARRRSCSGPTAPTRRRSSRSRAATCRHSVPTSRTARARSTSRSSPAWPSTARTGRSASRPTRPPTS